MYLDFSKQIGKKIDIKQKSARKFIEIESITHLMCDGYITTIYLDDNNHLSTYKLLKSFEIELNEFGFIRANHNTIVNPRHILELLIDKKRMYVKLLNNQIPVSRRRVYLFKNMQL